MTALKSSKILIAFALIIAVGFAAPVLAKEKELKIKTAPMCETCKDKMEEGLKSVDGVSSYTYNTSTQTLALKYDTQKTSPDKVKLAVKSLTCSGKADGKDCCGKDASHSGCDGHKADTGSKDGCCTSKAKAASATEKPGCCSKHGAIKAENK